MSSSLHLRRRHWILLDVILSVGAIFLAYFLQPKLVLGWTSQSPHQPGAYPAIVAYTLALLLSLHVAGLHDPLANRREWPMLIRTTLAVLAGTTLFLLMIYVIAFEETGRTIVIRAVIFGITLIAASRVLIWRLTGTMPRKIGVAMSYASLPTFQALVESQRTPFEIVRITDVATSAEIVAEKFQADGVDEVIVAAQEQLHQLWLACLDRGIPVTDLSTFSEREYYRVYLQDIDPRWFLNMGRQWRHPVYLRLKRMADIMIACLGLILSLPVTTLAAVAILVESGRPMFYSQVRVGFGGLHYRIWKFRSMEKNAERDGPQWAARNDTRVTKVGRILRRCRIDEIPQFWNVIKGDMALIGPRPERPEMVKEIASSIPIFHQRHWIKPGITGWAQINVPYGASINDAHEKLCYDLYYLTNASLLLDIHILLRTAGAVMKGSR